MQLKLHKVIEGPLEDPETGEWSNIYLTEFEDGTVTHLEIEHESMNECYTVIKMLATTIEPLILEDGDEECLTLNPN